MIAFTNPPDHPIFGASTNYCCQPKTFWQFSPSRCRSSQCHRCTADQATGLSPENSPKDEDIYPKPRNFRTFPCLSLWNGKRQITKLLKVCPLYEDLSKTLGTDRRHVGTDKIRWSMSMSMSMSMKSTPAQQTICFLLTMITEEVMLVLYCLLFLFVSIWSQNKVRLVKALVLLCHCLVQVFVFYSVIVFVWM